MRHERVYSPRFLKNLAKLPLETQLRIWEAVIEIADDPYAGLKMRGEYEGAYRWRVGEYRIIYGIIEDRVVVYFFEVAHRRSAYG